jgi:pimeloyl-ACP methyl ester carboxylesterase
MNQAIRRRLWFALRIALYALLALGGLALAQDSLLYFPDKQPLAQLEKESRAAGLSLWPGPADYRGLLREPTVPARATLVIFHGNAGHAGHREWYARELATLGVRVILAEYPGYGPREGKLGEQSLVADAAATLALARKQFGAPLLVGGESLGAGVAAATAAQAGPDIAALLLITPWDKLKNVASYHYPWFPVGWILRDRYDNTANLAKYPGRIAVVIAGGDAIVPARFGQALYDSLPQSKKLFIVPGAGHTDWLDQVDAVWWHGVIDFLLPPR